jgi:hypothetical protein
VKTARVRWGGIGGAAIAAPSGSIASATRWTARAQIMRNGANVQQYASMSNVAASGNTGGALGGVAGVTETAPITILVTGQNTTNSVANSVTCDYLGISYLKAPGT